MAYSYSPKFRVEGVSPDAHTYRADIEQDGYSGSVQRFTPAPDGLQLRWDTQTREDLNEPWMIGTGRIRVKEEDPTALAEIFDGGTFEYRVRLFQDGSEYFAGFARTDLYQDSLWRFLSNPTIRFTDGLGKLEDIAFGEAGSEEDVREAIMRVLNLLPTDLKAEINMRWTPNDVPGTPIEKLYVPDEAWVDDDTQTAPNPSPQRKSGRAVLRGLLRRFGIRLMQSGGQWRMRQRLSLMDDSLVVSTYNQDGTRSGAYTANGRERDLTTFNADEESRSFQGEFGASSITYNLKDPLEQVIPNPSFEDPLNEWSAGGDAQRVDVDTVSARTKTSGDKKAVKMTTADASLTLTDAIELPPDPRIQMQVEWSDVRDSVVGKISVGTPNGSGHDLLRRTVVVDNPALPGQETTLQLTQKVGQTSGSIGGMPIVPAGAELRLYTSDPSVSPEGNSIRLSKPLRVGDESVTGQLAQEISSTGDQDLKPKLAYWQWTPNSNSEETRIDNINFFTQHSIQVFMVHPSGDPVHGPVKVNFFTKDSDVNNTFYALDHVNLGFERDGEQVESFTTTAVDETGDREVLEVPVGIGPTDDSESRIYTQSDETPRGWGRGSSGTQTLSALHATESLQMQRTSPETRRFGLRLRSGDEDILPHHIYLDGSRRYEVIALKRDLLRGTARLDLAELQNDGTSGLSITSSFEGETEPAGGAGGSSSVQVLDSGGGGGASTWDELTGKPSGLFSSNGDSDGFAETQALVQTDITTALGYTPADETTSVSVENGLSGGGDLSGDLTIGISNGGVNSREIATDAVTSTEIAADAVKSPQLADDAIGQGNIADGSIGPNELKDNAVIPTKIALGDGLEGDGLGRTAVDDTVARTGSSETFSQNLTVEGFLDTGGVKDRNLFLNAGETNSYVSALRSGIEIDRGTAAPVRIGIYDPTFDNQVGTSFVGEIYQEFEYSNLSGSFNLHERIVGQSSDGEALIWKDDGSKLFLKGGEGLFSEGETVEGQESGATATVVSGTYRTTDNTKPLAELRRDPWPDSIMFWNDSEEALDTTSDLVWNRNASSGPQLENAGRIAQGDQFDKHTWAGIVSHKDSSQSAVVTSTNDTKAGFHTRNRSIGHGYEFASQDFGSYSNFIFRGRDVDYWYNIFETQIDDSGGDIITKVHDKKHTNSSRSFGIFKVDSQTHITGKLGVQTGTPDYALDVDGSAWAQEFLTTGASAVIREYQIGSAQNASSGISVRAAQNPNDGNNIFTVESSGGATRFGVTQNGGTWARDGLYVGTDHATTSPGVTGGDAVIEGQLDDGSYTSGILGAGYAIDPDANGGSFAEFDNLRIRNELRTHIFKKDIVRASNGYLLITDSAQVAESKSFSDNETGKTLKVENDDGNATFSSGDLLWLKSISDGGGTISGVKLTVTGVSPSGNVDTLTVDVESGGSVSDGDTIVRVSGGYLMNDASSADSPFLDVYDGVSTWSEFQSSDKLRARLGDLSGAPDTPKGTTPTGFGLYSENVYLSGHLEAETGEIGDWSINDNGLLTNGELYMGKGIELYGFPNTALFGTETTDDFPKLWVFGDSDDSSVLVQASDPFFNVASTGNTVMRVGENTAYIDNLEVKGNATIDGTVSVGGTPAQDLASDYSDLSGQIQDSTSIQDGLIDTGLLAADAVTATEVEADAITASEIDANTITATEIATDTVTATEIDANAITATEIAADTITASEISADTVTASEIDANTITATEIAADTITADQIDVSDLFATSATIENTLTIGSSGEIQSDGLGYNIDSDGFRLARGFTQTIGGETFGEDASSIYWSQNGDKITDAPVNANLWEGIAVRNYGSGDYRGGRLFTDEFLLIEHGDYVTQKGAIFFGSTFGGTSKTLNIAMNGLPTTSGGGDLAQAQLWVDSNGYLRIG